MRKNPGRRDRRWRQHKNAESPSEKKSAINERYMLWKSNWLKKRKKCAHFDKIFPEYCKEEKGMKQALIRFVWFLIGIIMGAIAGFSIAATQ